MNELEQLYQQVILDHAKRPHGKGLIAASGPGRSGESHQYNPTCGDEVTVRVQLADDDLAETTAATLAAVSWDGHGCSISQASASVLTDLVGDASVLEAEQFGEMFRELMRTKGAGLDEARQDDLGDAAAFTGVSKYPARIKCALLGWIALHDALVRADALPRLEDR